jgi:hypothetical protein
VNSALLHGGSNGIEEPRPKFREASQSHASDSPCRANTRTCEQPGHRRTVPPVVVSGDHLGGGAGFELLVGYTRLGNLLGMLDREEIAETQKHLVWVGRESRP